MTMPHYRLTPQRVDFVVRQWIGHDGYQLQGVSHRELDDLFTRYCQLEQEHPGVARRGEWSKRDRITLALEHANATRLTCLLEAILLMLPSGSATWRTPDREAQIRSWIAESKVQSVVEPESWDQATIHHEQASDVFGFAGPQRDVSPPVYPDMSDEEWFAPPQAPAPLEEPTVNVPTEGWFAPQEVPTHLEQTIWAGDGEKIPESTAPQAGRRDFFMSHAGEDKDFVRKLVHELQARGTSVWFDEHELMVGDSLSESIAAGLKNSRYGVVVLSRDFLGKRWPRHELRGLIAREMKGDGSILPIWHQITEEEVQAFDPSLVGKVALDSNTMSVGEIADALCRRLRRPEAWT